MKRKRKVLLYILFLLVLLNLVIVITGNSYLYKAIVYNFAGIDDNRLFPSRRIDAGIPKPWPLSARYNKDKLPGYLQKELQETKSVAYLVIKNDSIVHEQYWENYSDSSLSNSFSMAKTFVGILIGCALDEGKIKSLDQPLSDYLPEFGTGLGREVTIRHVLTMSSGINWDESYANPFSVTTKAYYGNDLGQLVKQIKVVEKPGVKFKYLSGNTLLLAAVLRKATGESLSSYFSRKIWSKIGAERAAEWSLDRENGLEKSYCCVYSGARDFAKIGKLFLDSGRVAGQQVVSASYVGESVKPAPLEDPSGRKASCYGYSWWILPSYKGHYIYYARGILGQYIVLIPDEKMIVVRLGWKRGEKRGYHYSDLFSYINGALDTYGTTNKELK